MLQPMFIYLRQNAYEADENDPPFSIPYFMQHYTVEDAGEEFELTWAKINAAWIDAPRMGRLQTVLTLDELRRSVWDDEFTYFKIAGPPFQW